MCLYKYPSTSRTWPWVTVAVDEAEEQLEPYIDLNASESLGLQSYPVSEMVTMLRGLKSV